MNNDKDNAGAALKDEDRAGLVNALKKQAGHRSDVLQNLTPKVRKRVDALRNVQGQHDDLEAKFLEERAVIEAKYQKLYQPLYTKLCLHLIPSMVAAISVTGPVNVPSHLKPQPLLNILLTMPEGPAGDDMKDFMLELCLMLPARLSSLLPYLPCLMKDLVFCLCLKGSDELVSLGSRSLEFWVDNLNPDFLEPSVANVMSEVTLSIRSHLRLVLPFQKEPLTLECKYVKSL